MQYSIQYHVFIVPIVRSLLEEGNIRFKKGREKEKLEPLPWLCVPDSISQGCMLGWILSMGSNSGKDDFYSNRHYNT